ncbi:Bacterio-opsin activator HTH domain-containing protein [Natronolimnohabitans innermongolicus JCM 12255]|uniref:Bacterio-opsin activator HTH domain-containing protein n=1 Tax=Natronolimnohabitans innermongolicus JCM 12255 TaxID=1227499 RepID=L9XC09_9EURY|nr:Bacterio-opsin activator HTH domain-containing protein [Natronolimnohabitans innermongolicus JCM 12255]
MIAELTLVHPELVLTPTIEAMPEMVAELEYQTIAGPDAYYLFFEASGGDFDQFDRLVADDPTVSEPRVIIDGDDFRVYRMRLNSTERLVLPYAAELGMRVLRAASGRDGWIATLEVPDLEALQAFRTHCRENDVGFTVDRLYHADGDETAGTTDVYGLTPIQRETLLTAADLGYFENPRGVSVAELADELEISSSAASDRLRRAMATLVEQTIAR